MRKLKFPLDFKELKLNKKLNFFEMQKVKKGKEPIHMDSKWVIYYKESWLYFHRFLTGNCIYKIHIECKDIDCEADRLLINGDPEQYNYENEHIELKSFNELFELFLESSI